MSIDFEERLRSEMAAVEVRPRPGLVREAYRGHQRRRRVTRAVAAAGTAAVAASGTAAGLTATASGGTGAVPAETAAYVVSHVTSALSGSGEIASMYTQYTLDGTPSRNLDGPSWMYGDQSRQTYLTPAGQPDIDTGTTQTSYGDVQLVVNYPARTWDRLVDRHQVSNAAPPDICSAVGRKEIIRGQDFASDPKAQIEAGLGCGVLALAGHQRIDGIDALTLVAQLNDPLGKPFLTLTLWVNPSTYLPVEAKLDTHGHMFSGASTHRDSKGDIVVVPIRSITVTFTWLPPTRADLALLTPPIPAGFRQVSGES
jgi:hypothetical protein